MRKNLPVTAQEHTLTPGQELVSGTDLKGLIKYANPEFIEVSGFSEAELLGSPHNIVRHPDVPPALFDNMWHTLKQGQPWMGVVKNRCKNGDFYWVDAYVTPVSQYGQVIGYESVRRAATREQIQRAQQMYQQLSSTKRPPFWQRMPYAQATLFWCLLSTLIPTITACIITQTDPIIALVLLSISLLASILLSRRLNQHVTQAIHHANQQPPHRAIQYIYTGQPADHGQLTMYMLAMRARLRTVLGRINAGVHVLEQRAQTSAELATRSQQNITHQQGQTDAIAAAMDEMSSAVTQIASHSQDTANATQTAKTQTAQGKQTVEHTIQAIQDLSASVSHADQSVSDLVNHSDEIGGVLDVIRDIADQTNLLALNAAIEAARAGESGRGFAVVADEVRTLAMRTQESTQQIQQMISNVQEGAKTAATAMHTSQQQAQAGVELVTQAGEALEHINQAVDHVTQMATDIANAAQQQNTTAADINANIHAVAELSTTNAQDAQHLSQVSEELAHLAKEQAKLIECFQE